MEEMRTAVRTLLFTTPIPPAPDAGGEEGRPAMTDELDLDRLKSLHKTCGHEDATHELIVPCGEPATSWRWYHDVEHEDCLLPACEDHANEGGRRMAELIARVRKAEARVRELESPGRAEGE
jgi:hypothetical protein